MRFDTKCHFRDVLDDTSSHSASRGSVSNSGPWKVIIETAKLPGLRIQNAQSAFRGGST